MRNTPPSQSPRAPHSSMTLQPVELPRARADPSCAVPVVTFGAPPEDQMSIAASEGERMSSGDEDSAALPPSGVAALPESDPEMAAMLSRAAASVRLEWNPPPCPEPSRLDDWFLGVALAGSQRSAPVPFFPEVHEEVTKSWTAPFSARSRSGPSSSLTTLDGGAAKGYVELPPVERSVAMQLLQRPLPLGGVIRVSPPEHVSSHPLWRTRLTQLVEKPLPPCMPWRSCRSTRPKRSRNCTRVVPTQGLCRNYVQRRTSPYGRRKSLHAPWVGQCPP